MKKGISIIIGAVLVMTVFVVINSGDDDAYNQSIEEYWHNRAEFLKTSEASPFVQFKKPYEPISYFPPNKDFKVNASLDRFTKREIVEIGNSDGTVTKYIKFAYANFKLNGTKQRLLILKALGFGNIYLTAFGDETSGDSTYGGGRYLDLEIGKSSDIVIDFNKSYSPYCAYIDNYTCPLPPKENLLKVSINAGEKH